MLSISCEGVAEGLRSVPGSTADVKVAFRAAERAMAAALRIDRRLRDLQEVAPQADMAGAEASTSRVAGQVGRGPGNIRQFSAEHHCGGASQDGACHDALSRCSKAHRNAPAPVRVGTEPRWLACCGYDMEQMRCLHPGRRVSCVADRVGGAGARRDSAVASAARGRSMQPGVQRVHMARRDICGKSGRRLPLGAQQDTSSAAQLAKLDMLR